MISIYRIASCTYRVLLVAIIFLQFVGSVAVGAAGHNSSFSVSSYVAFALIIVTVVLLSIFHVLSSKEHIIRRTLRYLLMFSVLVSMVFEIYFLSVYLQEATFSPLEIALDVLLLTMTIASVILLEGLIKDRNYWI